MKIIPAIIERANDGTYSIYSDDDSVDYLVTGTGKSVSEAKAMFLGGYEDIKRSYAEENKSFEEVQFIFKNDEPYEQGNFSVSQILNDVYEDINWAYLSKNYFGKSRSWLFHQFNSINDGKDDFSEIDLQKLKEALTDIASRLLQAADRIPDGHAADCKAQDASHPHS